VVLHTTAGMSNEAPAQRPAVNPAN